jgi:hypothetical protein
MSTLSAAEISPEPAIVPSAKATTSTYGLPSTAESVTDRIAIARIRARRFLTSTYQESANASRRALIELQKRMRRMKDEHPVAVLGVIASSALVLGMTLRICGSQRQ